MFRFNGLKYSPDFYDGEKNVFIEVAGSRQAYHANKDKYELFRKHFSKLTPELTKSDGGLLDEKGFQKEWQQNTH